MGVDLRNFQRKFQTLMGEVKPQIKPRIVVWLDERLAEFKIKGSMELVETLEDPKWIKDYYTSKRESKAAAIKDRASRDAGGTSTMLQPKLEQKSESSNGVAHPEELSELGKEDATTKEKTDDTKKEQDSVSDSGFQLVEVKREQLEEDNDDDMIIVGESIAPPMKQQQYNPMRQMYAGFGGRNIGPFQRKRQRFGSMPNRPFFKSSRIKQNFRPASSATSSQPSFPSHSATPQSPYTSTPTSQSFLSQSYIGETQSHEEESPSYTAASHSYPSELIRLPPHLQAEAAALQSQEQLDYEVTESDMYDEYGDESYDSSFLTEGESSIVYDEEGNAILKGENVGDESSMDPVPGTSADAASSQGTRKLTSLKICSMTMVPPSTKTTKMAADKLRFCEFCPKAYKSKSGLHDHIRSIHTQNQRYTCKICPKQFKSLDTLEGHINTHYKFRPYQCNKCDCSYSHKSALNRHTRVCVGGKIWQCDLCGTVLSTEGSYYSHMSWKHSEATFKCICGKVYTSKSVLWKHKQSCEVKEMMTDG